VRFRLGANPLEDHPAGTNEGSDLIMRVFCGIDWASDHHDVALVDADGKLLAKARVGDDVAGFNQLLSLLAEHGDTPGDLVPVAIETSRGLLVANLRATGRPVYTINPMAAARYRERRAVSRKKSDHLDAMTLAGILRTDRDLHRMLPADTELAKAVAILARAQQDAVWDRTQAGNKLRSHLREYYPGFLAAFPTSDQYSSTVARAVLSAAATPTAGVKLTIAQLRSLLTRAGRVRGIEAEAQRIEQALRAEQMRQPQLVEAAMGEKTKALLGQFEAACRAADDLEAAAVESFRQHPDAEIITSLPGLGLLLGARLLGEIGDDPTRFADARGLKAFAGAAPVTRASGKSLSVTRRRVKNDRLAAVGYNWAFSALTASPGAKALYQHCRDAGQYHASGLRRLFNKLLGSLYHCLKTRTLYAEGTAFPNHLPKKLQLVA
jgi:transposase